MTVTLIFKKIFTLSSFSPIDLLFLRYYFTNNSLQLILQKTCWQSSSKLIELFYSENFAKHLLKFYLKKIKESLNFDGKIVLTFKL